MKNLRHPSLHTNVVDNFGDEYEAVKIKVLKMVL